MSLPLPAAWAASEDGIGALIGFELLPVVGSDPVARLAEMTAHVAAELPAGLTVTVPGANRVAVPERRLTHASSLVIFASPDPLECSRRGGWGCRQGPGHT